MARAVEQIERELTALTEALILLNEEFHAAYSDYLSALSQAVRQQLIQACYHLCTHGYPEAFLKLSFNQRQQLQQSLQQRIQQSQQMFQELPTATHTSPEVEPTSEDSTFLDSEIAETEPEDDPDRPLTPGRLADWQDAIEEGVDEELKTLSHATNRLFQQTGVLPAQLPEPVLEVAAKAEIASEVTTSMPNLLNLMIETQSQDEDESGVTHIMAVRLRLSDLEFGDAMLMAQRSRLRDLTVKLTKLGREYTKRQREKAVAQAEAAWRSSWFEEE